MSKQTNKNRRKYLNILLFEVLIPVQEWEKIEGTLKLLLVLNLFGKKKQRYRSAILSQHLSKAGFRSIPSRFISPGDGTV